MIASFLTEDLHVWWGHAARHFLDHLVDEDIASNDQVGSRVAGTGTNASPHHRVFNPVTRSVRFEPAGRDVRRSGAQAGAPARGEGAHPLGRPDGYQQGYRRLVDHAAERLEALPGLEAAAHRQ